VERAGFTVGATGAAVSAGFVVLSWRRSFGSPFLCFGFFGFFVVSPFNPSGAAWTFSVAVCD
jgi:hypothetical protein